MGSNKDKMEKLEKKRLKQQYKLEKKRIKEEQSSTKIESKIPSHTKDSDEKTSGTKPEQTTNYGQPELKEKIPWYKNPDWLRAIAAIVSLAVTMIALIITLM